MSPCIQIKNELSWQKYYYNIALLRLSWQQFKIHQQHYVCEVSCEFIFGKSHAEINGKKEILVRDGALGLYHFFKHTQPKDIRSQLIISQKIKHLVPKSWQQNVLLYHLYSTVARNDDLPILVYGSSEGLPKHFITRLTSLKQQGEISLWLSDNNARKKFPTVQAGQAIAEVSLRLRTADCYLTHKLLSQGAALFSPEPTLVANRKIPVSPYHGFSVTKFSN